MPRRKDARNLSIQLTPEQYAVLEKAALQTKSDIAWLVREALANSFPEFGDLKPIPKRKKREPKKAKINE